MEYINGSFIMAGCDESEALHTVSDAIAYIKEVGFIPLFSNSIPGFSLEEHTAPSQWWTDDPESDPWKWRQVLSSDPNVAYGKFFGRNAGFISKDWFPVFANYRRNGYDFDALFEDELASYRSKKIMDVFEMDDDAVGRQIMSSEVKSLAGFSKEGGEKNFEGVITDLQMQTYLIMGGFQQKKNRKGQPFGWHIAVMETPETKWGRNFVTSAYSEDPLQSWQKIMAKVTECFGEVDEKAITNLLAIKCPGPETKPEKFKKELPEKKEKKTVRPQELPWPENLVTELGLEEIFPDTGKYMVLTDDQMAGLTHAVETLKDKEQAVIRLRYEEHKTFKTIGEIFNLSTQRMRQINAKALRKLRHQTRLCYIRDGFQGTLDAQQKHKEETRQVLNTLGTEDLTKYLKTIFVCDMHLTVRSTNCLLRANLITMADVAEAVKKDPASFVKIRNLGQKSLLEVVEKLEEYGIDCSGIMSL